MKRIVAVASALVALGGAAVAGIHLSHSSSASPRNDKSVVLEATPPNSLPFPDAVAEPDFATAEAVLGWHLVRPHSCYADDNKVASIYVSPTGVQAAIVYQDLNSQSHCTPTEQTGHVQVLEHPSAQVLSSNTTPTLAQETQAEVAGLGASASVQTVAGVPAVVIQGNYPGDCNSPAPGQEGCVPEGSNNPPSVEFQFGTVDIGIIGDPTWATSVMVTIGNTVN